VRIVGKDVGVPASPFVTRTIRLWMDFGADLLNHERNPVASSDGEEVGSLSVTSSLITNVEPQLGLIERKRSGEVVDNKKGRNTVQHSESAGTPNIALEI